MFIKNELIHSLRRITLRKKSENFKNFSIIGISKIVKFAKREMRRLWKDKKIITRFQNASENISTIQSSITEMNKGVCYL